MSEAHTPVNKHAGRLEVKIEAVGLSGIINIDTLSGWAVTVGWRVARQLPTGCSWRALTVDCMARQKLE